ncbi:MAG: DUF1343 domain-containing protein [Gemmatimonadetes bacterium]|nr:DUF1343 domain-containing protein [Gemmatimonadota bacterium]
MLLATACASQGGTRDPVRPGIEVLLSDSIHLVRGRRVGILTNQTGVDRTGKSDVDLLRESGINLTAIFSPEHGFRGNLDRENIRDTVDSATGVPIFSLYGTVRTPTPEMLARVDVLLLDLQDIGGRPYTYISTILEVMKAAREAGRPVIVLDRPNPIGGELVQGPMLDSAFSSFVGMLPVPLRHGLTIGELARFGNARQGIDADLVVIPAAGWRRSQWFDETGLPWVRPSPNMPNLESATHYPGLVLFERTNLSVGRGTPIAFQVIAAPWLDARRVREALPATPGAAVRDTSVTPVEPSDGKYPGRSLTALRFSVTDRSRYDPTRLAVEVLGAIRKVHPDSLAFEAKGFDERAGTDRLRRAIEGGVPAESTWAAWQPGIETFQRERKAFLIYR